MAQRQLDEGKVVGAEGHSQAIDVPGDGEADRSDLGRPHVFDELDEGGDELLMRNRWASAPRASRRFRRSRRRRRRGSSSRRHRRRLRTWSPCREAQSYGLVHGCSIPSQVRRRYPSRESSSSAACDFLGACAVVEGRSRESHDIATRCDQQGRRECDAVLAPGRRRSPDRSTRRTSEKTRSNQ